MRLEAANCALVWITCTRFVKTHSLSKNIHNTRQPSMWLNSVRVIAHGMFVCWGIRCRTHVGKQWQIFRCLDWRSYLFRYLFWDFCIAGTSALWYVDTRPLVKPCWWSVCYADRLHYAGTSIRRSVLVVSPVCVFP